DSRPEAAHHFARQSSQAASVLLPTSTDCHSEKLARRPQTEKPKHQDSLQVTGSFQDSVKVMLADPRFDSIQPARLSAQRMGRQPAVRALAPRFELQEQSNRRDTETCPI